MGTSGMVEPMSEKALTDTIQLELHQKHVAGLKSMILTPGNYGESFLRDELNVNLDYAVKCSNFIGDSLDMAVQENIEEVLLVGHGGKLIKLGSRCDEHPFLCSRWKNGNSGSLGRCLRCRTGADPGDIRVRYCRSGIKL